MYDYFLQFASRDAAKTDPDIAEHFDVVSDLFHAGTILLPKFWRHSQDTIGTDEDGNETRVHNYLPGFYMCVALPRVINRLVNHSATQLVLDRELINARNYRDGILKRNVSVALLKDLRWSPVFAGADYPWGTFD